MWGGGNICLHLRVKSLEQSLGVKTRTVACIARYKGGEWYIIDDTNHEPIHVLKIDSYDEHSFVIYFDFAVKNILTFTCTVDETYADYGFQCGASVGLDCALIYVHQIEEIDMPEEAYSYANIWIYGIFEVE